MNTVNDKRLLKQFLGMFGTDKLCEILRSVYNGRYINVKNREDAEFLLLEQPYTRIINSKKVRLETLVTFLKQKGAMPGKSKEECCVVFKILAERHLGDTEQLLKPIQPLEVKQLMDSIQKPPIDPRRMQSKQPLKGSVHNNGVALSINMWTYQSDKAPVQQCTPAPVPTTTAFEIGPNEILLFAKNFYDLFNNIGVPGADHLRSCHFYEKCIMNVNILSDIDEIKDYCTNASSILQCLYGIKEDYQFVFIPSLSHGANYSKINSCVYKVHIEGTLHEDHGSLVGKFEQQIMLKKDPQEENSWRIFKTSLKISRVLMTSKNLDLTTTTDMWENTLLDTSEVTESSEIQNQPHSPQLETLPMPPPPTQSSIQHSSQPEQAESQKLTKKIARTKNNNSSDADEAFIEYFKSKKAKINNSPRDIRADSIQQFLNSLIPDLLTMTDAQLRTYKRRSIATIDEILGTNLCTFSPATSVETRLQ